MKKTRRREGLSDDARQCLRLGTGASARVWGRRKMPGSDRQFLFSTAMVIPPSYAKQVSITNHANAPIAVEAVFGSEAQAADGHAFITDHITIAPHATVVLGEHEFNMGTWTAVAAVHAVHATHPASNARTSWHPHVSGIVSVVHVDLGESADAVTLQQRD